MADVQTVSPREAAQIAHAPRWRPPSAEAMALPLAWVVLIVAFSLVLPGSFPTARNAANILGSQAVLVVLCLGLLFPLRCGDFDLSVASTLTLSTMLVAVLGGAGVPLAVVVPVVLIAGVAVGLINSFFVIFFGINAFIVTLGVGQVVLGIVSLISGNRIVAGVEPLLQDLVVVRRALGVPLSFYYAVAICAAVWFVFDRLAVGRRLMFVGSNQDVARLSGIDVGRARSGALVAASVMAAIAGIMLAGTTGAAGPRDGTAFLLPAFAAAFLGATSIQPGRFNPWGAMIAAYFLLTGITGLQQFGANAYVQDLFYGGALVAAVALSQVVRGRQSQRFN